MKKISKQQALELFGVDMDNVIECDAVHFSKRYEDSDDDTPPHPLEKLNEMVVALTSFMPSLSPAQAVRFLATPPGAAFITSLSKNQKDNPMNRSEELLAIAKSDGGMEIINKRFLAGTLDLDEREWSAAFTEHAKRNKLNPKEKTEQAFSRLLEGDIEFQRGLSKAMGYPDVTPTTPRSAEVGSTLTLDDSKKSWDQAMALVDEMRKKFPALTVQQLFARVMEQNPELLERTRGLTEQDVQGRKRPNASSPSYDAMQR